MSNRGQYPKRNVHGDSSPRCEWCGKRTDIARMWRQYGTYCSLDCQAAGRPNYYRGLLALSSVFIIAILGFLILGYSGALTITFVGYILNMIFLVFFIIFLFYSVSMVNLGAKIIGLEEQPMDKDELEKICAGILVEVQRNHTPQGVSRKVLLENLRNSGYSNKAIKSGIEHLLVSEKLKQVSLTHYVVSP